MINFEEFDKQVDLNKLKNDAEEIKKNGGIGDFPDIPAGRYMVNIEKLELGATKDGRPMVKVQANVLEGEFKRRKLVMNRVVYGTKNDANMIASALGFLESLSPSEEVGPIVFESYSQLNDLIMDIADDISGLEYDIEYDSDDFNPIHVVEVFEKE